MNLFIYVIYIMSAYSKPKTDPQGNILQTFNASDYQEGEQGITVGDSDQRYLQISGGTEGASVFTKSITCNYITLSQNSDSVATQSNQLGYTQKNIGSMFTKPTSGSAHFGSINYTVNEGIYLLYFSIYCTTDASGCTIDNFWMTWCYSEAYQNYSNDKSGYAVETFVYPQTKQYSYVSTISVPSNGKMLNPFWQITYTANTFDVYWTTYCIKIG